MLYIHTSYFYLICCNPKCTLGKNIKGDYLALAINKSSSYLDHWDLDCKFQWTDCLADIQVVKKKVYDVI